MPSYILSGVVMFKTSRILAPFALVLFAAPLFGQVTFTGGAVIIVDNAQAAPSFINVSGYTGSITKVTVTLNGFTHTFTDDVAALVTGPNQNTQNTLLFDGPGLDGGAGTSVTNLTLTFDDAAVPAVTLPQNANFGSGTYLPGLNQYNDAFTAPAPAAPYNTNFSSFNGASPDGDYTLYLRDYVSGDSGSISSWSIIIFGITPVPEPTTVLAGVAGLAFVGRMMRRKS